MYEQEKDIQQLLHDALSIWWLRPENALALASYCMNGISLKPEPGVRAADFACGDGVNTFFKCGGRFDERFDLFSGGVSSHKTTDVAQNNIDVFDYVDDSYQPAIVTRPDAKYSYGTDHKQTLLDKARKLDFYGDLLKADLREQVAIPQESLDQIYCNSLYWVEEIDVVLGNFYKLLKPGGKLVLDVFTMNKKKLFFEHMFPTIESKWTNLLNRGRNITNPGLKTEREYDRLFRQSGFRIEEKRDILPAAIAEMWNIGLRPIFPALNKMASRLTDDNRAESKREWIAIWADLLLPVLMNPQEFSRSKDTYRFQYVLVK